MKRLQALVQLHRWQLEEKRRHVAELATLAARLASQIETIDRDLAEERRVYDSGGASPAGFAAYAATAGARRRNLDASIEMVGRQIAAAEEEMELGYRNLERFETALESHGSRVFNLHARRVRQESSDRSVARAEGADWR